MTQLILIAYMAYTCRLAGGGIGAKWMENKGFKFLSNVFFAFPIAGVAAVVWDFGAWWDLLFFLTCLVWSTFWFNTGHHEAIDMGEDPNKEERDNTLTPLVLLICKWLKIERDSIQHDRVFLAVKGFLFTLPVFGIGGVLYPLGYELGHRLRNVSFRLFENHDELKEWCAGAMVGLGLCFVLWAVT